MSKKEPTLEEWRDAYLALRRQVIALKESRQAAVGEIAKERLTSQIQRVLSKLANPDATKKERREQAARVAAEPLTFSMLDWAEFMHRVDSVHPMFGFQLKQLFGSLSDIERKIGS